MLSAQLTCGAFGSDPQCYRCICLCSSTWFSSVSFLLSQSSHLLTCSQCCHMKADLSLLLIFVRVIANRIQLIKHHLLCNCVCEWVYGRYYLSILPCGAVVKNLPANAGDARDKSLLLGLGRSPIEGMATHSSILAWKIPWTEEPGGL